MADDAIQAYLANLPVKLQGICAKLHTLKTILKAAWEKAPQDMAKRHARRAKK
jgi:hypothetical protein